MKKLCLSRLEITSFVTNAENLDKKTLKGGADTDFCDTGTFACTDTITILYGTCGRYPCRQIP